MKRLLQFAAVFVGLMLSPLPGLTQALCFASCAADTMPCCRHPHAEMDCGGMPAGRDAACSLPCCAGGTPPAAVPQPATRPPVAVLPATAAGTRGPHLQSSAPAEKLPPAPLVSRSRYLLYRDLRL